MRWKERLTASDLSSQQQYLVNKLQNSPQKEKKHEGDTKFIISASSLENKRRKIQIFLDFIVNIPSI